jgi:nucleoid-associated protein YgaU
VVVSEPGRPSRVLQGAAKTGPKAPVSFESVDYDDDGQIILAGRVAPGADVRAYLGEAHLGDAKADTEGRWVLRTTRDVNPGVYQLRVDRIDTGGEVLARVVAPFERAAPEAVARARADGEVVIQPGDNLWNISRALYGTGTQYTVIYDANRNQIGDPDLIFPGQVFMTPGAEGPERAAPGAESG